MTRLLTLLLLLVPSVTHTDLSSVALAEEDDWTQFRGSKRDAVWGDKGLLQTFPPEGIKIRWRVPIGGGYSSPVVAQGRVYVSDSEWKGAQAWEHLRCLDEKSGASIWIQSYEVNYDASWREMNSHDGPRATPTVHDGMVYHVGANADLFCLDAVRGDVVWKKSLVAEYNLGDYRCITPSPLIEGDLLILLIGGKPEADVVAFDRRTGKEVWRALEGHSGFSSPIIVEAGGKRQLILWGKPGVTSLDPASGRTYWKELHELTGNYNTVTTPVASLDRLLVAGMMFRLHSDAPAATLLWPRTMAAASRVLSFTSMPLIRGDYLYSDRWTGMLVCMEIGTGKVVWKTNQLTKIASGASLHLTDNGDDVWIFTDQGNLIRARLTPEGYQELSRAHLLDPTTPYGGRKVAWVPPAFANRHVFARSEKELVCASLEEKKE